MLNDLMVNFYERVNWDAVLASEDPSEARDDVVEQVLEQVDEEVTRVIGEAWTELKKQNETFVAHHTLLVLAMCVNDPMFKELSAEEQNILKWASLLHDIAKLSTPAIRGKDHIHPMKSGVVLLEVFERLNFIENVDEQKRASLSQVRRLLQESVQPVYQDEIEYLQGRLDDPAKPVKPYCTLM